MRKTKYERRVFHIIVEGETEEIYFNALRQLDAFRNHHKYLFVVKRTGSIDELFKWFENGRIGRNGIIFEKGLTAFVFDKNHLTKQQLQKILSTKNYLIGFSNPKIELWLLAHFIKLRIRKSHSDVEKELLQYLPNYSKPDKRVSDLAGDFQLATENSKICNKPDFSLLGTSVGEVLEMLVDNDGNEGFFEI